MEEPKEPVKRWKRRSLKDFMRHRLAVVGSCMAIAVILIATLAPFLSPHNPYEQDILQRLLPPFSKNDEGKFYLLGTDHMGRDILSRIIYGSRISVIISLSSVLLSCLLGLNIGLIAGYYGGILDSILMRLVDLQLAFPFILLAMTIVALLGATMMNIIIVFAITSWPIYARVVRGSVLSAKEMDFVQAARAVGNHDVHIIYSEILPNVLGPLTVIASFEVARMIIMEAAMGFLGFGIQPPTPTWGNMLADGRGYVSDSWWLAAFPGMAIMFTAAGINFIGDGLRDFLDPRLKI